MALAEVKTLYDANARDIPQMLRKLADEIEKGAELDGQYGDVQDCAVVTYGERGMAVFGFGTLTGSDTALLFSAGAAFFTKPFVERAL